MHCNREMYQAGRWHNEFPSPMTVYNSIHIYVNDFIIYHDDVLNDNLSKVVRIFMKEGMFNFHALTIVDYIVNFSVLSYQGDSFVHIEVQILLSPDQASSMLHEQDTLVYPDESTFIHRIKQQ